MKWWVVGVLVVTIKLLSLNKAFIEEYYSNGIYIGIGHIFRILFGWLPFSFGDLLYFFTGLWLLWKLLRFFKEILSRKITRGKLKSSALNGLYYLFLIYISFNISWGLNYNRLGAAYQLGLKTSRYDSSKLKTFVALVIEKVNQSKIDWIKTGESYPSNKELFRRSKSIYDQAKRTLPFIGFEVASIKSSMFSKLGNYLGFTGYYNPFTGEAQVNTISPAFLLPFTTAHEMAHQAGYAKENEASFVAFLAITQSGDQLFLYSTYLDLFIFANRELYLHNRKEAIKMTELLIPEVKKDIEEWRKFSLRYSNPVEPFFRWGYGNFLKINDQPQGMLTYNEVIGNVIAYYDKFGKF